MDKNTPGKHLPIGLQDLFVETLLATSDLRAPSAVVDEATSASAELFEINDTDALIRTVSGTTAVEPVAVTEMYRRSAAFAIAIFMYPDSLGNLLIGIFVAV